MEDEDFENLLRAKFRDLEDEGDKDIDELCRYAVGVSFSDFVKVARELLPLTPLDKSNHTSGLYRSYSVNGVAYVKMKESR